jgi:hypothetical protein
VNHVYLHLFVSYADDDFTSAFASAGADDATELTTGSEKEDIPAENVIVPDQRLNDENIGMTPSDESAMPHQPFADHSSNFSDAPNGNFSEAPSSSFADAPLTVTNTSATTSNMYPSSEQTVDERVPWPSVVMPDTDDRYNCLPGGVGSVDMMRQAEEAMQQPDQQQLQQQQAQLLPQQQQQAQQQVLQAQLSPQQQVLQAQLLPQQQQGLQEQLLPQQEALPQLPQQAQVSPVLLPQPPPQQQVLLPQLPLETQDPVDLNPSVQPMDIDQTGRDTSLMSDVTDESTDDTRGESACETSLGDEQI